MEVISHVPDPRGPTAACCRLGVWGAYPPYPICTSSQTTMPTSHHSVFYRPDALPAAQPTASKHWKTWALMLAILIESVSTHIHTHKHTHMTILYPSWTLSRTIQVSQQQKGKSRKVKPIWIYWSKRQWVAVASAGPYASLHLDPDTTTPASHHSVTHSNHTQLRGYTERQADT